MPVPCLFLASCLFLPVPSGFGNPYILSVGLFFHTHVQSTEASSLCLGAKTNSKRTRQECPHQYINTRRQRATVSVRVQTEPWAPLISPARPAFRRLETSSTGEYLGFTLVLSQSCCSVWDKPVPPGFCVPQMEGRGPYCPRPQFLQYIDTPYMRSQFLTNV